MGKKQRKKKWIMLAVVGIGIAGVADLIFEGLVYQQLPVSLQEKIDKIF